MKKLLSLSAVVLISAIAFGQDTIPPVKKNPMDSTKVDTLMKKALPDTSASSSTAMPAMPSVTATDSASATKTKTVAEDKVVMADGKMMVIKKGDSTLLADSILLKNGTIVKKDASVIFKDGTTAKLTNGQSILLEPVEKEVAKPSPQPNVAPKAATTVPPAAVDSASSTTKTMVEDKVIMKDDHIVVIKSGDSTLLADSIKLESGAVVMKDGSVKYSSGKTVKLKNGQYINLNVNAAETKKIKKSASKKKAKE